MPPSFPFTPCWAKQQDVVAVAAMHAVGHEVDEAKTETGTETE